ncbi:NAD(P)/FAD-dependent oxidoreductase [Inediibacterium massiliense]|uniref:NAD(P)/FAD-dependent oxidoreductase n=1 Tax=Inediibacterium massiliense TaxID=1658111 RepID=UPI0006B54906|nr:NAD(P)/FAD-dependent oxidoreductase [Inediibacterium massiliense]
MIRVNQIKLDIKEDFGVLQSKICKKLRIKKEDLIDYKIFRESIDARKGTITLVYTIDVEVKNEENILKKNKGIQKSPDLSYHSVQSGSNNLIHRPIIIGTGPAGIFAGLILAQRGYKPILLERGQDVDTRTKDIEKFWKEGTLNIYSNVQFGEGGAGTFSDGKLTTRIKDIRCRKVLDELVESGAPKEILYSYKPHIGTDVLKIVVKNIRKRIEDLGGEVRFNSCVTDFYIEDGKVTGLQINKEERLKGEEVILAIGHSARDTYEQLYEREVFMTQKPFSIGVRIEHPQGLINYSQYKQFAENERLGAADYRLTYQTKEKRAVYTFCMCPGGFVVGAASEEKMVVTNGMSEYKRDQENANSALLVQVNTEDFEDEHPLAGINFQRKWEKKAFELGGKNFYAPIQLVGDFLKDQPSTKLGEVKPSYLPGVTLTSLDGCLPKFVIEAMKEAIPQMDKKLNGFAKEDAILTGVETRSSAPVRIQRKTDEMESVNVEGLYPVGEGAGYAGGIISAAVDGIKAAERIIKKYHPINK